MKKKESENSLGYSDNWHGDSAALREAEFADYTNNTRMNS